MGWYVVHVAQLSVGVADYAPVILSCRDRVNDHEDRFQGILAYIKIFKE